MDTLTPETVRRRLGYMAEAVAHGSTDPYELAVQASDWYEALYDALCKEQHALRVLQENFPKTIPAAMDRPR